MEKKTGKPELEDGFIRIATELFDALISIRIPGEARQVFDFILRKTYGYHKTEDAIALRQISATTGIRKPNVIRAISMLIDMNLVLAISDKKSLSKKITLTRKYKINKYYQDWRPLSKRITFKRESSLKKYCYLCGYDKAVEKHHITPQSKGGSGKRENIIILCPNCHTRTHKGEYTEEQLIIKKDNVEKTVIKKENVIKKDKESLSKKIPTKDSIKDKDKRKHGAASENEELLRLRDYFSVIQKDNDSKNQDDKTEPLKYPPDSLEIYLAVFLIQTINKSPLCTFKPKLPVMSKITNSIPSNNQAKQLQLWAHYFHLLLSIDKRTTCEIKELIQVSQLDEFWYKNVRSPIKLRKHWDRLQIVAHEALAKVRTGSKKSLLECTCEKCGRWWTSGVWNSLTCPECGHYNQQYEYKRVPLEAESVAGGEHADSGDHARMAELVEQGTPGQPQPPTLLLHQGEKDHGS